MGQVTIYLDNDSEKRMKQAANAAGMPISRWMARLVYEKTHNEWPQAVREAAGAWKDFPEPAELRQKMADDAPRESL